MVAQERKQAVEYFAESEKQRDEAQLLANLGIWRWDILTGVLTWPDELYLNLGLDKDAFVPTCQAFLGAMHPDDKMLFREVVGECLEKRRRLYDCELRIARPGMGPGR